MNRRVTVGSALESYADVFGASLAAVSATDSVTGAVDDAVASTAVVFQVDATTTAGAAIAWLCFGVPLLLVSLVGHGAVIAACLCDPLIRKHRTAPYVVASSLAAAGTTLFGMLNELVYYASRGEITLDGLASGDSSASAVWCNTHWLLAHLFVHSYSWTHVALAFDRCLSEARGSAHTGRCGARSGVAAIGAGCAAVLVVCIAELAWDASSPSKPTQPPEHGDGGLLGGGGGVVGRSRCILRGDAIVTGGLVGLVRSLPAVAFYRVVPGLFAFAGNACALLIRCVRERRDSRAAASGGRRRPQRRAGTLARAAFIGNATLLVVSVPYGIVRATLAATTFGGGSRPGALATATATAEAARRAAPWLLLLLYASCALSFAPFAFGLPRLRARLIAMLTHRCRSARHFRRDGARVRRDSSAAEVLNVDGVALAPTHVHGGGWGSGNSFARAIGSPRDGDDYISSITADATERWSAHLEEKAIGSRSSSHERGGAAADKSAAEEVAEAIWIRKRDSML